MYVNLDYVFSECLVSKCILSKFLIWIICLISVNHQHNCVSPSAAIQCDMTPSCWRVYEWMGWMH